MRKINVLEFVSLDGVMSPIERRHDRELRACRRSPNRKSINIRRISFSLTMLVRFPPWHCIIIFVVCSPNGSAVQRNIGHHESAEKLPRILMPGYALMSFGSAFAMKYAYENLGDEQFETLIVFLCQKILGVAVQGFSKGPDGGRDAKFVGTAELHPSKAAPWVGTTIIQAKHTNGYNRNFSESDFFNPPVESAVLTVEVLRIK